MILMNTFNESRNLDNVEETKILYSERQWPDKKKAK